MEFVNDSDRKAKSNVVKILVMGSNDDKKAIIQRYVFKTFNQDGERSGSSCVGIASKYLRVNDEIVKMQLWDYSNYFLSSDYCQYASAAMIVFDITDKNALKYIKKCKAEIDANIHLKNIILVANKWDLVEKNEELKQFTDTELDEFCIKNNLIAWFSCSAKTGMNVKKMMNFLIWRITQNNKKRFSVSTQLQRDRYNTISIQQNIISSYFDSDKTPIDYYQNNNMSKDMHCNA
eukprot:261116_1